MASSFSTRRAPVDPEDVCRIANAITAEGKQVTALLVLDALGGGSLRTIYKHLNEWEKNRKEAPHVSLSSEVPEPVKAAFASVLANTWRVAAAEAAREVTATKEKAAAEVAEAQAKFDGALDAIQRFEADIERDAATIEELKTKIADLEQAVSTLSQEKAAARATAEQLGLQVKAHETELERLHKDRQEDRQAHREQMEKLANDQAAAQNKAAEQIERLHKEKEEIQKTVEQTERDRQALQLKLEQAEKQTGAAEKTRDQAGAEREKFSQEAAQLRGTVEAQAAQIERLMSEQAKPKPTKE